MWRSSSGDGDVSAPSKLLAEKAGASSVASTPSERPAAKIRRDTVGDRKNEAEGTETKTRATLSSSTPSQRLAAKIRGDTVGNRNSDAEGIRKKAVASALPSTPSQRLTEKITANKNKKVEGCEKIAKAASTPSERMAEKIRRGSAGDQSSNVQSVETEVGANASAAASMLSERLADKIRYDFSEDRQDGTEGAEKISRASVSTPSERLVGKMRRDTAGNRDREGKGRGVKGGDSLPAKPRAEVTGSGVVPVPPSYDGWDRKIPARKKGERKTPATSPSLLRPSLNRDFTNEEPPSPPPSPAVGRKSAQEPRGGQVGMGDSGSGLGMGVGAVPIAQPGSATQSQIVANNPYGDIVATARLVEEDEDEETSPAPPPQVNPIEGSTEVVAFATAKRVSPVVRFAQDHCLLVSVLGLAIIGGVAGLSAYLATRTNGTPAPSPLGPRVESTPAPSVSASPTVSSVPSGVPTLFPTSAPTEPCNMPTEERRSEVIGMIEAIVPNPSSLADPSLPQSRALAWLANEDELFPPLCPGRDNGRLTQRFGLALLHFAMGGEGWRYSSSEDKIKFLEEMNECDWAAVDCNSDTKMVTRIQLGARNIRGTLPKDIFSIFGELKELNMEDNKIGGSLPGTVANLSNLEFLYLSNNDLTNDLPPALGGLSRLEELDLSGNSLKGVLPDALLGLAELRRLRLDGNELSGFVPKGIGSLGHLEDLDLSDNFLEGPLPAEFPPNLVHLRLNNNGFVGTLPASIARLTSLKELYLHRNWLSGEIPQGLGKLVSLRSLALSYNNFGGTLPDGLGDLAALEVARFESNWEIGGTIPASLAQLDKLKVLTVQETGIIGNVSDSLCALKIDNGGNLKRLIATCEERDESEFRDEDFEYVCDGTYEICCSCCECQMPKRFADPPPLEPCTIFGEPIDDPFVGEEFDAPPPLGDREDLIATRLLLASDENLLSQPTSAQARAANWLIFEDQFSMGPDDVLLLARYAMAVLYFATNGDEWLHCSAQESSTCGTGQFAGKERFLSNVSICEWGGITCDFDGFFYIELDENGLRGDIPIKELSGLCLKVLSLRGNPEISVDFESGDLSSLLVQLELLDLSENGLSGTLSEDMFFPGPNELHMNDNIFSGTIPSRPGVDFGSKSALRLDYNMLSGSIPPEFGSFYSAKEIRLDNNFLTGVVPDTLGSLDSLEVLTLNNNDLIGSVPDSLCDLTFESGGFIEDLWADCGQGVESQIECECCTRCFV